MLIPWSLSGLLTEGTGEVEFSIKFFKTALNGNDVNLVYELNTAPVISKILEGIPTTRNYEQYATINGV